MTYFLDTSSWIKRYSGEKGFEKIDELLENEEIVIYDLAFTELISNLYRLFNEKYLTKNELEDILDIVYQDLSGMQIIKHNDRHIIDFVKLCDTMRQTPIDGMIILLAKEIEDVIIITSDERLKKGADLENIKAKII